jgi:hypothetical protein
VKARSNRGNSGVTGLQARKLDGSTWVIWGDGLDASALPERVSRAAINTA